MHRDIKIGLILGVLLVALVAALFFRRERVEDLVPLALSDAALQSASPVVPLEREQGESNSDTVVTDALEPVPGSDFEGKSEDAFDIIPLDEPGMDPAAITPNVSSVPLDYRSGDTELPVPQNTAQSGIIPEPSSDTGSPVSTASRDRQRRHRVVSGDSLWSIAEEYLGDGSRASDIYDANRSVLRDPDIIPSGINLVIPVAKSDRVTPVSSSIESSSVKLSETAMVESGIHAPPTIIRTIIPRSRRVWQSDQQLTERSEQSGSVRSETTYRVKRGDSLRAIARKVYQDEDRWRDIYEANRRILSDPHQIHPGMTIHLPRSPRH